MVNILGEDKKQQVVALGRLGWTLRRIEEATGIRRETAGRYLKAAGIAVRAPGRWGHPGSAKAAIDVSTDSVAADGTLSESAPSEPARPARAPRASACEPYQELIERALDLGRNARAIWQDLVDDHGFAAGYASVRRFAKRLRRRSGREAHPVIVTPPGEEAQVDYGTGPMIRHPQSGRYQRTRLFVLTLGYSRKSVRLLTFRSSTGIWAELHERAFRRLGGAPRVIVLDNLREGVIKPDFYDPTLNPLFRDLLKHYGVVALPCRVADPDRKGKVESGVGHAQATPLKGLRFDSLEDGQSYLDRWEQHWADTRIHGTTKRQVAAMFAEERPALLPLPLEPFRHYQFAVRTVHLDGCVEVECAYYGAPPGWLGRDVSVQWDGVHVRLLDPTTGELLREHRRHQRGHHRILDQDKPKRTPPTTLALLTRARHAGPKVGALCQQLHEREGQLGVRRLLGVLSLVKKYGPAVVDDACAAALELGIADYRFLRRYLERQPAAPISLRQVDPLIRQLTHYRDVIAQKTQEVPS